MVWVEPNQEVYLRPSFSPKKNGLWLDFIDNGEQLIHGSFRFLDPNPRDDRFRSGVPLMADVDPGC